MIGQRFGRLEIIGYAGRNKRNRKVWICKCDCGNTKEINQDDLKSGRVNSCGCLRKEKAASLNYKDLTGMKFGEWNVISRGHTDKSKKIHWLCECSCGNRSEVSANSLLSGNSTKCIECSAKEKAKKCIKHGKSKDRIYNIYRGMKSRCLNKNNYSYSHYGERGIKVCDEWLGETGFKNFYDWAMNHGYSDELSIDRINVDGNYDPNNCRWATKDEQQCNKTNSILIEYKGEKKTVAEWAKIYGINYYTLLSRIKSNWDIEKALLTTT